MNDGWWHRDIVEPGKLPLLLALLAFVVTFAVTRLITRLIRAGRGPFRNISPGGLHVHHVVPGIVLMTVGGFTVIAGGRHGFGSAVAAAVFGAGAALVLDEFALVLHLSDVYWTKEGTKSVEIVLVVVALTGLLLAGFAPFGVNGLDDQELRSRGTVILFVGVRLLFCLIALVKGKLRLAVVGVLVPFVALFAAVRLARPGSPWAKHLYRRRPRARARAARRAYRHDRRWSRLRLKAIDLIGGTPTAHTGAGTDTGVDPDRRDA
ncbi:hypothetical protein [Streptomyces beihaiensis]|uniref:Integral membrane protein n=1 Tax=Streptomyces beihaiensis TaxID=2984495 RepID=A0ABT3TY75_9ACTN|nr:hypothetical protein [Streptomyces beihaiensis]MCX3061991.1 hypothetical protein [Streptomyces beihaiensis]